MVERDKTNNNTKSPPSTYVVEKGKAVNKNYGRKLLWIWSMLVSLILILPLLAC